MITQSIQNAVRRPVLALAFLAGAFSLHATDFALSKSGALQQVEVGKNSISLDAALGGFSARDAAANVPLDFSKGATKKLADKTVFDSPGSGGISLHAEFVAKDNYVLVNGYLDNSGKDNRAIILEYRLGFAGKNAVFSDSLNRDEDFAISGENAESEGNTFPLAALTVDDKAISVALPPLDPRTFGVAGNAKGLAVRFYLGISPLTKAFPNRASFSFIVYPSAPGWGFRDALEKYYSFYPELYERKSNRLGFFLCQVKGFTPENIDQYALNVIEEQNPHVKEDLTRDQTHKVLSLLYTLIGQREIKFLDKLPENYEEALNVFANWSVENNKGHAVTKEGASAGNDAWLKQEVESSGLKDLDGKYEITIRNTPWGKNSISFKTDPSPYLDRDKDIPTVGRDSIRLLEGWIKQYPQVDGVIVDSLGANWPANPDYSEDHFAYTQYPLTFDSKGKLFLHNETSHYEWVRYVRDELAAQGKYLFANGVYAYRTQALEHYLAKDRKARIKVGRFFVSALLDGSTSEAGTRATTERCQDVRVMMGRKFGNLTNTDWVDPNAVEAFFNRTLAYGIFASNTAKYGGAGEYVENVNEGISYVNNKDGDQRYKDLTDWFLSNVTILNKAGWHPTTDATLVGTGTNVYLERYGSGNQVYFTVFNDSDQKTDATIKVDLKALGFPEGSTKFEEISRNTKVDAVDADQAKIALEPHKTYILSLNK